MAVLGQAQWDCALWWLGPGRQGSATPRVAQLGSPAATGRSFHVRPHLPCIRRPAPRSEWPPRSSPTFCCWPPWRRDLRRPASG
eukprot:9212971-Alexandrium_andersonii.AAC.1